MMGLPAGWVTNVPISRNDQLKACGNGVVPQQAAAALRHMFTAAHAAPHQGGVSVPARW
jgi:DNA (cytosine-5)-methyltransferase 1